MRKIVFTTIIMATIGAIWSCSDDSEDTYSIGSHTPPSTVGQMFDGGFIRGVDLYCLDKRDTVWGEPWHDYYQRVKTLDDFSHMDLRIMIDAWGPSVQGDETLYAISLIQEEYEKQKTLFMQEAYSKYLEYARNGWPFFYTAYIKGGVTLTCDKDLYGEKAGTDLSRYFGIFGKSCCIPKGIDEPFMLYNFCDVKPDVMSDYLLDQTWLQDEYYIHPLNSPAEEYDEIVLTVTIPMTVERTWDYATAKYNGFDAEVKREEKVVRGECTIRFN